MYKLLHKEKTYLSELKESIDPDVKITEYLDYLQEQEYPISEVMGDIKLAINAMKFYTKLPGPLKPVARQLGWFAAKVRTVQSFRGSGEAAKYAAGEAGPTAAIVLGGTVAAGLAIMAVSKLGKRFLSQSAKACKGKSGAEKTDCMTKFKNDAIQKQIELLSQSKGACSQTKNPGECTKKLDGKIADLKGKMKG